MYLQSDLNLILLYAKNKSVDQPVQTHSLISPFGFNIIYLESSSGSNKDKNISETFLLCSDTETSKNSEILHVTIIATCIILSRNLITNGLNRLH